MADGQLAWDPRLLSPERALALAGTAGIYAGVDYAALDQFAAEDGRPAQPGRWQVNLRCGLCHQSCGLLGTLDVQPGATLIRAVNYEATSITDLLAGVLRHLVMAHDVSLSGAPS